jgi:hypothetical protein
MISASNSLIMGMNALAGAISAIIAIRMISSRYLNYYTTKITLIY